MKRLTHALLFSLLLSATAAQDVPSEPATASVPAEPQTTPTRLLYQQLPSAEDSVGDAAAKADDAQPNPLVASAEKPRDASAKESDLTAAAIAEDREGLRNEPPLSLREKYNIHGTVYMGFGSHGLLYGGVGVSADLSDNVSLNLGASTTHWDGDGWYWPVYPFQE